MSFARICCQPICALASLMLLSLALVSGCGGPPPVSGSDEEVTVSGTVTLNGEPVTQGTIIFDPSNRQRKMAQSRTAEIQPDGTYTITTLKGQNQVIAEKLEPNVNVEYMANPRTEIFNEPENSFNLTLRGRSSNEAEAEAENQ